MTWAYIMRATSGLKLVRSCPGMLKARKSKFSASVGNCREAARPVPSMPGTYSIRGSSVALSLSCCGRYGLTKRGGPSAKQAFGELSCCKSTDVALSKRALMSDESLKATESWGMDFLSAPMALVLCEIPLMAMIICDPGACCLSRQDCINQFILIYKTRPNPSFLAIPGG